MQKYIDSVIGETGRPVSGASVTVYLAGTQTLATIYSNNGVTTQANPLTTDSSGAFSFYAADGRYDIVVMKNNTSKIISDVLLEDPANASSINASTLTANSATITNLTSTVATISTATIPSLTTTTSTSTNLVTSDVQTNTIGIGTATTASNLIKVGGNAAASALSNAMVIEPTIQSNVTNSYRGILSRPAVAASVTLPLIAHFYANPSTFGGGAVVSSQMGFYVENTLTGATNNYGFYSAIQSGSNRWNLFMVGDADNYLGGRLGIKTTANNGGNIEFGGTGSFSGTSGYGISQYQTIPSSVTNQYWCNTTVPSTSAAFFTLSDLRHYNASQGSIGAGSSITNQYGYYAGATLTGAANNYGFYSAISSGSNRWNFYATGTALNHFNGRSLFGTTTDDGVNQIQSSGHISTVTAGFGFKIKEGSNAKMGVATLVAGSVVVANTSVTASSRIQLTSNADGGTPGWLRVSARTAGTSFTITSSSGTDTSTVAYLIMEPA